MCTIRKCLRLTRQDRNLLIQAGILLIMIRVGLWVLPFRKLQHMLNKNRKPPVDRHPSALPTPNKIGWAVTVVSRCIPGATCLPQALATQQLLGAHGYPAHLRIGIAKNSATNLDAHAWVESEGQIIIGGSSSLFRYIPMPPLENNNA